MYSECMPEQRSYFQVRFALLWDFRATALHTSPYQTGQAIRRAGAQR